VTKNGWPVCNNGITQFHLPPTHGPVAWNTLPATIRNITDSNLLKRLLKSHFYNHFFNITP